MSQFFAGLRLLPPGVVRLAEWWPDRGGRTQPPARPAGGPELWGGAGQK